MKLKYFLSLSLFFLLLSFSFSEATIRYVSKSGTSQPPYTSWQTAADSIQKCTNICSFGDTVYVANGVYKERIDMIPGLSLIGAGMDSCIIDTRTFLYYSGFYSVRVSNNCELTGFQIITQNQLQGFGISIIDWTISIINSVVKFNKTSSASTGIDISTSGLGFDNGLKMVRNNFITEINTGISSLQTNPVIEDNIIYPVSRGLVAQLISKPIYRNNIIVLTNSNQFADGFNDAGDIYSILENNLFFGKGRYGLDSYGDTIRNNVIYGQWIRGYIGAGSVLKNNHIEKTNLGLFYDTGGGSPPIYQYNNMWDNTTNFQNFSPDTTNVFFNPMFVNPDSMDFKLQMYSPLIDAGDPSILDKDGSRSDIGLYGGPNGEKYTYRDLAPKPPSNLTAIMDSGLVKLTWNKNTEAEFSVYRVYRDTVPDFMYDTTKIIAVLSDTVFFDDPPQKFISGNYYYKITALDNTQNQSAPSEEVHINITGIPEAPPIVVEHYRLLNNYPNPFNSSTIIPYRLKEGGYVKLYIYDMQGELVRVLVNGYQSAGYYEARFSPTEAERNNPNMDMDWHTGYNDDVASGVYLYQIMVRGEGDIPVFTDMGKMILLK